MTVLVSPDADHGVDRFPLSAKEKTMNTAMNAQHLRTLAEDVFLGVTLSALTGLFLHVAVTLPL